MSRGCRHIQSAGGLTMSWAAGELFERAAQGLTEPPTTEALFERTCDPMPADR